MGRGGRAGRKRNRKINGINVTDSDNSDEDYFIEEDESDDQFDELEFSIGGGRMSPEGNSKKNGRTKVTGNSDEDYFVEEDETDDLSDELDSLVEDDTKEEANCSFEEEEDMDEEEKIEEHAVTSKAHGRASRPLKTMTKRLAKRKRFVYDDEHDEVCDIEEEEELTEKVVKSKAHKTYPRTRENGVEGPRKRSRAGYQEEEEEEEEADDDDDDDNDDDDDYDQEDEEDEDDEEFTPDEIDSLDEEEEIPVLKRGDPPEKRRASVKRWGWKRSLNVVKKSLRKKREKCSTLRRKCNNDEDFIKSVPASRGKSKKKRARRRPQLKACSDSDFVISGSSDYEFTISEEEQEQVKEANKFCKSVCPSLRTQKRVQEDSLSGKGKEKAEDVKNSAKQVCGICLTEEGNSTFRGILDCCCHYFCFACIMEWSKVETRCPLCKQRFVTISKHARSNVMVDLRNKVIHVPERNQVYQPSEDELRDYLDPYENVICIECQQGGDDALMLLCDLCDSPAHTYCVGLGREVPVGNWYCEGCRPSALGSANNQTQDYMPDHQTSTNVANESSMYENMAEIDLNLTIPETPLTLENGFSPSPRYLGGNQAYSPVNGVGVSTVFGRRRIHRQIHNIWSTNRMSQVTAEFGGGSASDSRESLLGSQVDRVESTTQVAGSPTFRTSQQASNLRENLLGSQVDRVESTTRVTGSSVLRTSQQSSDVTESVVGSQIDRVESTTRATASPVFRTPEEASDLRERLLGSQMDRVETTTRLTGSPVPRTSYQSSYLSMVGSSPSLSAPGPFHRSMNYAVEQVLLAPTSVGGLVPRGIQPWGGSGGRRMGFHRSTGFEQLHPCTSGLTVGASTGNPLYDNEGEDSGLVKQLASTVRSHLKVLSRGTELGYNTFEDIAESSKHTILVACGLEHHSNMVYQVHPPQCSHREGLANTYTSLIGGCCSSCFDSFVRDVVRSVMDIKAPSWFSFRN